MKSDIERLRAVTFAVLVALSTVAGTVAFTGTAAADASAIDIGVGNGTQVTVEAGPSIVISATLQDNNSGSNDNYAVWIDKDGDEIWDVGEPNATYNIGSSGSSEILLVDFNLSTLSAGTYNVSAVETNDAIKEGLSANKTVEDQLKVVQGAPPELQSAVHYDNGTAAAEVELAFDENVSAVRTLKVSTVGSDANLTESVSVSEGRVVATLDGVYAEDLEVAYDVTDAVGNAYATDRTTAVRFAAVTTGVGDGDTVYAGSTLAVLTNRTNASVDIDAADGTFGRSESTGANSKVYLVDTGTLDPGAYEVVYGGDDRQNATFDVESLGLAVGVGDATVTNADGSVVAGTVSANASDRSVAVELRDADESAVATDDAVLDGRGEYDYAFDASGLAAGDYAVVAVDAVSGAESRSEPVVVSNPRDDDDDDSEYSDYRDPTATPSSTSTERTTTGAGPLTESSDGAAADDAVSVEGTAEDEATADGASDAAEGTRFETANDAADAAAPVARSESGSETATGTEVPGFGVGAAVAALLLGASLAGLAVRRDR